MICYCYLTGKNQKLNGGKSNLNYTRFSALSSSSSAENDQGNSNSNVSLPVPPGMSEVSFKRVTHENPMKPEELEQVLEMLKFT